MKKYLDNAVRGDIIEIERGGMIFTLMAAPKGAERAVYTDLKPITGTAPIPSPTVSEVPIKEIKVETTGTPKKIKETPFPKSAISEIGTPKPPEPKVKNNFCEHFQIKGKCLTRGCKYGIGT